MEMKQLVGSRAVRKAALLVALFSVSLMMSSCFVDYGLEDGNYDLVATSYDPSYNFGGVTKYTMIDSVVQIGTDPISHAYDDQIKTKIRAELNALGWQEVNDTTANVTVMMSSFSTTTVVYGYGSWWDYYGWYGGWSYYPTYGAGSSWYYPYYPGGYYPAYEYTTGSLAITMVDLRLGANDELPVQWIGILNGLMGSGNVSSRIDSGISQAFAQSPYLK